MAGRAVEPATHGRAYREARRRINANREASSALYDSARGLGRLRAVDRASPQRLEPRALISSSVR